MAKSHSSQTNSITPVKDKETKKSIVQNISRLKLSARNSVKLIKTVNSDYVGVCLHTQSLVVYLNVNLIRDCFNLSPMYQISQIAM